MKKKRRVRYYTPDDRPAGDEIDRLVAQTIYGTIHNSSWFIKEKRKIHYYGPRFSTDLTDAMEALRFYNLHYGHLVKSYCLLEQTEKGPYSATAELRHEGPMYTRSWAPTLPLAISRMLLKAPKK